MSYLNPYTQNMGEAPTDADELWRDIYSMLKSVQEHPLGTRLARGIWLHLAIATRYKRNCRK